MVRTLTDARLNMAKAVLAFEATKITHGEEEAVAAWKASASAFGSRPVERDLFPSSTIPRSSDTDSSAIPSIEKSRDALAAGIPAFELFHDAELVCFPGRGETAHRSGGRLCQ